MDLTLVPICNDQEHILDNKYRIREYYCSICYKEGINYQCINCDYARCEQCHKDVLRDIRDKQFEALIKISMNKALHKSLLREQSKLTKDGLTEWSAKISRKQKELYYYNNRTRTISFDYPIFKLPDLSPDLSEEEPEKDTSNDDLSIPAHAFKVFQGVKAKVSNLNIY
jgi:hypothetical protein